ncbi:adenine nucleotide alpha hydrolases-like protein [Athelia psychrophila]|uniref:Adenine nucleotide alpha hydrolases-like protein n=1 Tax=Athelia psychrophila TaxID=1759441 RepID=A0A166WBJ9_9AGAM|nr:adenine nucleotide alpha hydrolases-like protein [Fibularhizoctonia sp. CBS 109695]
MGSLSALSLNRSSDERGRQTKSRASSFSSTKERDVNRARSQSPFSLRRFRSRDSSPTPVALEESDTESVRRTPSVRPKTNFTDDPDSESEFAGDETEDDDDEWSDEGEGFDSVTEFNTEQNALSVPVDGESAVADLDAEVDPDPLGEGVNVIIPPEPYFPTARIGGPRRRGSGPKRRKSRTQEELPHSTSRPIFQRDRCTINIIQGDPDAINGKHRRFMVGSDLSQESQYAVEWGIGTVLRDGDELVIVTVQENEAKVDPLSPANADRAVKLRSQQERQGLAYILVRQATSLLQRTRLNVVISCQAWHAKNARHMLLDIVDYNEPTMLIVGSRGLSQMRGILLGSTSHYLIEKCSVPVMVARRRLKRPPRRSANLTKNRVHVSLAEAGIDRVAPKVDQDVATMRDQIERDEQNREGGMVEDDRDHVDEEEGNEAEEQEDSQGHKVAG